MPKSETVSESELRTLPRKLAERMISETDNFGDCSLDIAIAKAEAVILEAIEQMLERVSQYLHHDKICAHRKDSQAECDCGLKKVLEAYAAIRSLKPAKPEETK